MSERPPRRLHHEIADVAVTGLTGLALALALRIAVFQPFTIPSSSMEPGLVTGDYILVSKWAYGWSRASLPFNPPLPGGRWLGRDPHRGDVVVFRLPRDPKQVWIKRVIGLPGDRVQVRGGVVSVNGVALPQAAQGEGRDHDAPGRIVSLAEEAQGHRRYPIYASAPGSPGADTDIYRMPDRAYLVMGDNRDNSLDGRWPREVGVGYLPADNLVGRATIVAASWRNGASILKPWTWLNLDAGRFLKPIG
ncbi:MAG: signal peptidase I [Caulobacterales bacterium 68-7]|nr:MAG: signal peptidase I [Caulobacterales bacterium 68-7]